MRVDGRYVVISIQALELCQRAIIFDPEDSDAYSLQSCIIFNGMNTLMAELPPLVYEGYERLVEKYKVAFLQGADGESVGWCAYWDTKNLV